MTEWITARQFHEADGVADWRVVAGDACAYFRTGDFATGTRFVGAIGALPGLDAHHPDVDVRHDGVTVRLITVTPDVWVPHDQAEARIAAALAAGGTLVSNQPVPAWWVLADPEGNEVCIGTWLSRD